MSSHQQYGQWSGYISVWFPNRRSSTIKWRAAPRDIINRPLITNFWAICQPLLNGGFLYRWISVTICIIVKMNKRFLNLIVYTTFFRRTLDQRNHNPAHLGICPDPISELRAAVTSNMHHALILFIVHQNQVTTPLKRGSFSSNGQTTRTPNGQ